MNRQTPRDNHTDMLSGIVRIFLNSNLSIILIIAAALLGLTALLLTPREEYPQIVVPLADVYVSAPGYDAKQVEQLVSTPLERMLSQIDGVEYVYSMSQDDQAIITVRFYVGQDRERSLVKLFKKMNENFDSIPPAVEAWSLKPVEIDDVPVVTFALKGASSDSFQLRRIGEELVERLASIKSVNRAYLVGGQAREIRVEVLPDRLQAHQLTLDEVNRAIRAANQVTPADEFSLNDQQLKIRTTADLSSAEQISDLVVGVSQGRPVYLKDVAQVIDTAEEPKTYVRHGWGPAAEFEGHAGSPGTVVGGHGQLSDQDKSFSVPSVTVAISKQKGANAVHVASAVIAMAEQLKGTVVPDDVDLVITRNNGLTANEKVNELIEALGIAILIVVLLLTLGMGWREALIVAIAVPVVFGLTLLVNLIFGYTINRVTLFALILALGLLVDDPIVDVENIARHFHDRKRASRRIVLDAVAEIRPPLISATLAVIVSFLPMFFITGMMGPYMSPMALNVPVAMLMSMLVAFTITPWLTYQVLKKEYPNDENSAGALQNDLESTNSDLTESDLSGNHAAYDPIAIQKTLLYRFFKPLMLPLLKTRLRAVGFLAIIGGLTFAAMWLGALRMVPLKMLPFDNKNEFVLVVDMDEGQTLERTSAVLQELENTIAKVPEVIDYTTYVGSPSPIDFNGMVRHYYLRNRPHQGEMRINLVGKKNRTQQSHAITLRLRDELTALVERAGGKLRIVELPPGPPVLASIVAELYGRSDTDYSSLLAASQTVAQRLKKEPGVVEVDDMVESSMTRMSFIPDQEKSALAGISVAEIGAAIRTALAGESSGLLRVDSERHPLDIVVRLPKEIRHDPFGLGQIAVKGRGGDLVRLSEIGKWRNDAVGQTIYHKNLQPVAYVMAETAGRPPADCIIDILADQETEGTQFVEQVEPSPVSSRSFIRNGSGVAWGLAEGIEARFSGEGEWQITLDVFRDLGLAFGAAMVLIYIILVAQTGSFFIPLIVMLAIPLTVLGVMPGFYGLNQLMAVDVGGYSDPVFFTATAMIGMIALSGIVTRDSIILVDFMEQSVKNGRPLFDAILESRVVRLRPILLTAGAAMLSAIPITLDPIFSGLGWSLIFGLVASTVFTLFVIPVTYWLFSHGK